MTFKSCILLAFGLVILGINSVPVEVSFFCPGEHCSFICGNEYDSGSTLSSWASHTFEKKGGPAAGTLCEIHINVEISNFETCLAIRYIIIDGYNYTTPEKIKNLFTNKDNIIYKYSNGVNCFFHSPPSSEDETFEIKIPENLPLTEYDEYNNVFTCPEIIKTASYNSKIFYNFQSELYEYTSIKLEKDSDFIGAIDKEEIFPNEGFYYYTEPTKEEGYNVSLTYTYFRYGKTEDCSGKIKYVVYKKNCTDCYVTDNYKSSLVDYSLSRKKAIRITPECYFSCLNCSGSVSSVNEKQNCYSCKAEYIYYILFSDNTKNCYNKPCISNGLFQIENTTQCLKNCSDEVGFRQEEQYCVKNCKNGNLSNKTNGVCPSTCDPPGYLFGKECISNCTAPYFHLDEKRLCVQDCKEENYQFHDENRKCLKDCSGYGFYVNDLCTFQCPKNYTGTKEENGIIKCSFILDEIKKNSEGFKEVIYPKETVLEIITSSPGDFLNKTYQILGNDYYMETFSIKNTLKTNSKTSSVDLNKYIEEIAKKNSLSPESIIVVKIDTIEQNSVINKVSLQFFSNDGKKLIEDGPIKYNISFPLRMEYLKDIKLWEEMMLRNFDIYNREDELFHKICLNCSVDNIDLTVDDRIAFYYKKPTMCQEGCNYISLDFEAKRVNCSCGSKIIYTPFPPTPSNFELMIKCYKSLTDIEAIKKNMMVFTGLSQLVLLISVVLYSFADSIKMKAKILSNVASFENPPRTKGSDKDQITNDDSCDVMEKGSSSRVKKENVGKGYGDTNDPVLYNVYHVNNLPFEKAKICDNRTFMETFFHTFLNKQMFLRLFFPPSKFESKSFNFSLALFLFLLLFVINFLFYSSSFISDTFRSNKKIPFDYILLNSFYSMIIEILIFKIIFFCSNDIYYIETALIEIKDKNILYHLINHRLSKRKSKSIMFMMLFILVSAFVWFYLSIFSNIYRNTQKYLYIQSWSTFILSFFFYAFLSLVFTFLRFLGLRLNYVPFYNMSFILNYF